ncbi:MAG: 30S ribosome-binding factor RbfA [Oscillospiraceae bacterium]|nr:30S ribosome-binding factor RbfA [Oscillospiraceae bacterium]MDD4367502.1 30S ribosome-binding factor RbfA [Oscillospiraceae bacterium]
MSNNRPARVGDEIRRELADLLQHEVRDPRIPQLTSITAVEVSGDLSHANVFISVMGTEEEKRACFQALSRAQGFFRTEIGKRMRLRVVPELHFKEDDSIDHAFRLNRLIDQAMGRVKVPGTSDPAATAVPPADKTEPDGDLN